MAALMNISADNAISEIRVAWGSVGPTVMRFREIENFLVGRPLTPRGLGDAILKVQRSVIPINDIRSSANYRREVAGKLLLRLIGYTS
jgi:xanthine dehydrogenase FAD-binding subunit